MIIQPFKNTKERQGNKQVAEQCQQNKELIIKKIVTILDNPHIDRILSLVQIYLPNWQVVYGSDKKPAIFDGDN
jgi:hypothetical protein